MPTGSPSSAVTVVAVLPTVRGITIGSMMVLGRGDLDAVGSTLCDAAAEREGMLVGGTAGAKIIATETLSDLEPLKENTDDGVLLLLGSSREAECVGETEGRGGAMGVPLADRDRLALRDADLVVDCVLVLVGDAVTVVEPEVLTDCEAVVLEVDAAERVVEGVAVPVCELVAVSLEVCEGVRVAVRLGETEAVFVLLGVGAAEAVVEGVVVPVVVPVCELVEVGELEPVGVAVFVWVTEGVCVGVLVAVVEAVLEGVPDVVGVPVLVGVPLPVVVAVLEAVLDGVRVGVPVGVTVPVVDWEAVPLRVAVAEVDCVVLAVGEAVPLPEVELVCEGDCEGVPEEVLVVVAVFDGVALELSDGV